MFRLRWLVIGLIALPFLEFATFFWVADEIGFLAALLALLATSALGVMLLRGGARVMLGRMARDGVVVVSGDAARNGALTAIAGLLLAIPGFLTDVLALLVLVPVAAGLLRGGSLTPATQPAPARGVVDLDPADWHEERSRPLPDPRLGPR